MKDYEKEQILRTGEAVGEMKNNNYVDVFDYKYNRILNMMLACDSELKQRARAFFNIVKNSNLGSRFNLKEICREGKNREITFQDEYGITWEILIDFNADGEGSMLFAMESEEDIFNVNMIPLTKDTVVPVHKKVKEGYEKQVLVGEQGSIVFESKREIDASVREYESLYEFDVLDNSKHYVFGMSKQINNGDRQYAFAPMIDKSDFMLADGGLNA